MLPPVDFEKNIADLSTKHGVAITPEQAMSSLMYPKVFSDYMSRLVKLGPLLKLLPTRVYWYAMVAGDAFSFDLSKEQLKELLATVPPALAAADDNAMFTARLELQRVSALQRHLRSVVVKVEVQQQGQAGLCCEELQTVQVKDMGGVFVFEGPMADPAKASQQVGSPMAGIVEKVEVKAGQQVTAGDLLCVVSAMKMEVSAAALTNVCDGEFNHCFSWYRSRLPLLVMAPWPLCRCPVLVSTQVVVILSLLLCNALLFLFLPTTGYRVVEGALLVTLK